MDRPDKCPECEAQLSTGEAHLMDCLWEYREVRRGEIERAVTQAQTPVPKAELVSAPEDAFIATAHSESPGMGLGPIPMSADHGSEPVTGELVPAPKASLGSPGANAQSGGTSVATPGPGPAGAKRALAAQRHIEYIGRLDGRVRSKHTRIVEQIAKAADIDTGAPKPEGWTDREYRIAQDARNGPREAPYYLQVAQRVTDSYKRAEVLSERDPAPRLNCDIQVFVQQNVYNYEVKEEEK